ncbi:transcription factor IIIB 90 kDa subunit-like [Babylonia areolata]|uniref:transcription factor IIIB 90 kDa subunit-like n=1 Tax=Babylonia areolata TaxID=304850 RepID=UPI003FD365B2
MSGNVCKHCGCNEIDEDATRGDKVCTNCGSILEDQLIVSEIQFQENLAGRASVMGQFVSVDGNKSYSIGGSFIRGIGRDSHTVTLQNAKRKIQEVADQLRISNYCQDVAFNYFKMVLKKNLTRGRKSTHVVASCLYIVCRKEGLPHMLLDFSDVLQVNVYTLGKTYLHISKELCLQIPVIDPCLYIDRFANKLQFGDKTGDVCATALRLVQRMTRDWMHTGRRPSGLCGAALLVSSRMHDFNRTVKEVIKVVKVCESTIRKRLYEFEDTPSSQLTIEEFHNIDLEEEQDPPCFTEGKKRSKLQQIEEQDPQLTNRLAEVESLQQEIEKSLVRKPMGIWAAYSKVGEESPSPAPSPTPTSSEMVAVTNFIEEETLRDVIAPSKTESPADTKYPPPPAVPTIQVMEPGVEGTVEADKRQQEQELMKQGLHVPSLAPTAASLGIKEMVEECITVSEENGEEVGGELDLEGIDEEELDKLLLSEAEVKIKTEIWMKENEDFLKAQKEREEKRLKEEQEQGSKPEKKKRKYKRREKVVTEAASAKEAFAMVIQEKKLSRKINYEVLEDLRCKDKETKSSAAANATGGPVPNTASGSGISQSILKADSSSTDRSKRPSLLEDSEDGAPPAKRKNVKIQEPAPWREEQPVLEVAASPQVVEETGPVPYRVQEHEVPTEEEEEEEEDDEHHLSARRLFGRDVSMEEEDHHYYGDSD